MSFSYHGNIDFCIYGESHSDSIGIKCTGLPCGIPVDTVRLNAFLERRRPGKCFTSVRNESDLPIFLSGVTDGKTDGNIFQAEIKNTDVRSSEYSSLIGKPRPGHADYPYFVKTGKLSLVGGGEFSGRMTAPVCILGGILLDELSQRGIDIYSRIVALGNIRDDSPINAETLASVKNKAFPTVSDDAGKKMLDLIEKIKADGDSIGSCIECVVTGLPIGLGGAGFEGLDGKLAYAAFSVPAVKGIEFGNGFECISLTGSENNDPYEYRDGSVKMSSNRAGGVLGGMSCGEPIVFRVALKPTPTVSKPQNTVDMINKKQTVISANGRHDTCVGVRAVPVIEAVTAITIADVLIGEGML